MKSNKYNVKFCPWQGRTLGNSKDWGMTVWGSFLQWRPQRDPRVVSTTWTRNALWQQRWLKASQAGLTEAHAAGMDKWLCHPSFTQPLLDNNNSTVSRFASPYYRKDISKLEQVHKNTTMMAGATALVLCKEAEGFVQPGEQMTVES